MRRGETEVGTGRHFHVVDATTMAMPPIDACAAVLPQEAKETSKVAAEVLATSVPATKLRFASNEELDGFFEGADWADLSESDVSERARRRASCGCLGS